MLNLRREDIIHRSHLHRLLLEMVDQPLLAQSLAFKGGTCAAMRFFTQGYAYHGAVIRERSGLEPQAYIGKLIDFIKTHVTQTIIDEDLNSLLPYKQFQQIRKILIPETLFLLEKARV